MFRICALLAALTGCAPLNGGGYIGNTAVLKGCFDVREPGQPVVTKCAK
jgi:hypothetical protein